MRCAGSRKTGSSRRRQLFRMLTVVVLGTMCGQIAAAQSFAVRNPKKQTWPQAEAEKIYKFASQAVEEEFKPRRPVRPQFTLVLGYEKDQMDVNSNELRLTKWDRQFFTEGVVLFGFEQMLSSETKLRMVQRALKESDTVLSVNEARKSSCSPGECWDGTSPKR